MTRSSLAPLPPTAPSAGPAAPRRARPLGDRDRVVAELHATVDAALRAIDREAAVAWMLLGVDDDGARARLATIADRAAGAVAELRRLLAALTDGRRAGDVRAMIARDVHDGVGHGLSLASVLAGAALATVDRDRAGARRAVADGRARASGQDARLRVAGGPLAAVPGGVLASLRRIVQEALTNARRHAPGATVEVEVRVDADAVALAVRNGPPSRAHVVAAGCGRGIEGMRDRARLLGGHLQAGPTAGGGFAVRARLPR